MHVVTHRWNDEPRSHHKPRHMGPGPRAQLRTRPGRPGASRRHCRNQPRCGAASKMRLPVKPPEGDDIRVAPAIG